MVVSTLRPASWLVAVTMALVAGCDAVRVEGLDHDPDGRPAERPQHCALVAFGPASLSGASLEETSEGALAGLGNAREGIDVAAVFVTRLEAAVCGSLSQAVPTDGCAGLAMEADAAIMDGRGRFGGVVAVRGAPHPTQLARLVAETPFVALVGDGALALAGAMPRAPSPALATPAPPAVATAASPTVPRLLREGASNDRVDRSGPAAPPQGSSSDANLHADAGVAAVPVASAPSSAQARRPPEPRAVPFTVGAMDGYGVALRLGEHDFAAAVSTAGALRMPRGRMTAVPVIGASVFSGPEGAVAATGDAGHLIRTQLARQVYQRMLGGLSPREAATWATETAPEGSTVNIVVVNRTGSHAASSRHSHAVTLSFSQSPDSDAVTVVPAR